MDTTVGIHCSFQMTVCCPGWIGQDNSHLKKQIPTVVYIRLLLLMMGYRYFRNIYRVLLSPQPDQEGNKLQRQKILMFIYPIYNHNWRNISTIYIYNKTSIEIFSGVLISPQPDQEGNRLRRQKILSFIYPIYNHNWRNISTIHIYNKTSIKRNILTIKQNTTPSRSG